MQQRCAIEIESLIACFAIRFVPVVQLDRILASEAEG
jgi:hypothetical protein